MKLKSIALAGLAGTALIAGAAAVPAQAATKTTVSIHVQNVNKTALKDIGLAAEKGDSYVFINVTNAKGNITKAAGLEGGKLSAGTWKFTLFDTSATRHNKKTAYAVGSFTAKIAGGKNTSLGTKTLQTGSHIKGTVTAPSGRVVQNAQVGAFTDSKLRNGVGFDQTTKKGTYLMYGLRKGTYYVSTFTGGAKPNAATKVTISKAGSTKSVSLSKVRVACSTGFTATSETPGQVSIKVDASAADYGLTNPGGSVQVFVDGTLVETVPFKDIATFSKTYTEQASGDHTYAVKYTGGDCYGWSESSTVSVNSPS